MDRKTCEACATCVRITFNGNSHHLPINVPHFLVLNKLPMLPALPGPTPTSYFPLHGLRPINLGPLVNVLPRLKILFEMGRNKLETAPIILTALKILLPLKALFLAATLMNMTLFSRLRVQLATFIQVTLFLICTYLRLPAHPIPSGNLTTPLTHKANINPP